MSRGNFDDALVRFIEGDAFTSESKHPASLVVVESPVKIDDWEKVTSFRELLKLNLAYVRGNILSSPYRQEKMPHLPSSLLESLTLLHRYGFLIKDGLTDTCENGIYISEDWTDHRGMKMNKGWVDIEQRSYLDFYVEDEKLVTILLDWLADSNYVFTAYNFKTDETSTNLDETEVIYNLARNRTNLDKDKLSKTEWKLEPNVKRLIPRGELLWGSKNDAILMGTTHFAVVGTNYCEGDIERSLISLCQKHMSKVHNLS